MNNEEPQQMTHSDRMAQLREQVEAIQGSLETLITCKDIGNLKQVSYWVGQVSRQVSSLCRECMGEELLKAVAKHEKGRIITR